jgi:hypothetical protein
MRLIHNCFKQCVDPVWAIPSDFLTGAMGLMISSVMLLGSAMFVISLRRSAKVSLL